MSPLVFHRPNSFQVSLIKLVFCAQKVPASCTETFSWVLWSSATSPHMFLNKTLTFWEQQASPGSFRLSWHKGSSVLWGVLVSFTSRQCYTAGLGGCRWKESERNPAKAAEPSALENDFSDKSWFPLFFDAIRGWGCSWAGRELARHAELAESLPWHCIKPGMTMHICNPSTWDGEVGGAEVQCQLHSEFEASPGYMTLSQNETRKVYIIKIPPFI